MLTKTHHILHGKYVLSNIAVRSGVLCCMHCTVLNHLRLTWPYLHTSYRGIALSEQLCECYTGLKIMGQMSLTAVSGSSYLNGIKRQLPGLLDDAVLSLQGVCSILALQQQRLTLWQLALHKQTRTGYCRHSKDWHSDNSRCTNRRRRQKTKYLPANMPANMPLAIFAGKYGRRHGRVPAGKYGKRHGRVTAGKYGNRHGRVTAGI